MRLGYCCINLSLKDQGVTINRGMTKKTWLAQGLLRASLLAEANLRDLHTILRWNAEHNIQIYRMSSDIFPWMSEYSFEQLPNYETLVELMSQIGPFIEQHGMRISFHPGQFDVLASPSPHVVDKTVYDLDQHSRIMDLMCLPKDHRAAINIHIGGTYGEKESAAARFCKNFERLADSTRARLVVENDDKATQFGVLDLYRLVHAYTDCPITFDHLHHRFCTNGLDAHDAAQLAASTWKNITPLQHYSSSKLYEDVSALNRAHADYVYEIIPKHGLSPDIEIEAKAKDLAVLRYLADSSQARPNLLEKPIKFSFE